MSGIIGKLSFEQDETLARPILERMLDAVAHRGRSEGDIHQAPGIALGGAIVGSATTTWVVADSRLSNARELRNELRRLGCLIQDLDDATLIAYAYEAWGEQCFSRLEGPCACAVWDARTRRLLLARDPLGIKPLYFALLHGHGVAFASEVRALFHDPGVGREYAPAAIDAYLTLGYVPAPLTAFRRVSKLEPGQFVVVDGRRFHAQQYWDLPAATVDGNVDDLLHEFETHLRAASKGDSECNILLSGGLASSALAATTPEARGAVAVFVEQDPVELTRAQEIARAFGHRCTIDVASFDAVAFAPRLAARFDEPIASPRALSEYAIYTAATLHGGHASSGHGAAALLAGAARQTVWDDAARRSLYTRSFAWEVRDTNPRSRYQELCDARSTADALDRAMYVQLRSVLADNTLLVADRASLAAGLSLHFPYLDRRLVEFLAAMPSALKMGSAPTRGGSATTMPLLRRFLSAPLPADLMPPAPVAAVPEWLQVALPSMVASILLAPRFDGRGIVSRPALRALWDEHVAGRRDHTLRFWSLLMLEFWFREFIDGSAAEEPLEYAVLKAA